AAPGGPRRRSDRGTPRASRTAPTWLGRYRRAPGKNGVPGGGRSPSPPVSGGTDADGSASRPGDASASSEVRAEQAHPTRILRGAGMAASVRPWPGTRDVAHVVALDQQGPPPVALLRSWLNDLRTEGYTSVRT